MPQIGEKWVGLDLSKEKESMMSLLRRNIQELLDLMREAGTFTDSALFPFLREIITESEGKGKAGDSERCLFYR